MDTTIRALNRFGLGARLGEVRSLGDPRAWLRNQLDRAPTVLPGPSLVEIGAVLRDLRQAQRSQDQERLRPVIKRVQEFREGEMTAMLSERVTTDTPFVERLVAFWSNHLCVSIGASRQVAALAGHYERTVVRPHVLGRFADMVAASARHPAMLLYLNNAQSIGPGSLAGRRTKRRGTPRGLNENYARELMELHTLGVDGGYSQADVEQLARILTGWTVSGVGPGGQPDEPLGFVFRPILHEPGSKTVLGRPYAQDGEAEGTRVIEALCAHPATADFIAGKLVRHFVSDDPPSEAVARISRVFSETDGDLREVADALIDLDAAWLPENRKFRTPQDWLVAVLRSLRATEAPDPMAPLLNQLRHTPWAPPAPKGYGDTLREWADPDSLMNRAELSKTLSERFARGGRLDPRLLLTVMDTEVGNPLGSLLADTSIATQERLALAFGGPSFQWR